jgi:hypothetical protein
VSYTEKLAQVFRHWVIGLRSNHVIRRGSQRFSLEVLSSVMRDLLESNEMEDNQEGVSRNDNHMCLRKEPLHRCLFGLLGNFCTSPIGICYKYGKVVVASTWGKQKRKSNTERIDGIPLFVMPVVSLRTPFWSKQNKIVWTCPRNGSRNEFPYWLRLADGWFIWTIHLILSLRFLASSVPLPPVALMIPIFYNRLIDNLSTN